METIDFKVLSLALYQEDVLLTLSPGLDSSGRFGKELKGHLVGWIWGSGLFPNSIKDIKDNEAAVIALTIKVGDEVYNISCNDLEFIKRLP